MAAHEVPASFVIRLLLLFIFAAQSDRCSLCSLEAKSFGLGLTLSGLDLGLEYLQSTTLINIHNIAIDNHFCCVLVAY